MTIVGTAVIIGLVCMAVFDIERTQRAKYHRFQTVCAAKGGVVVLASSKDDDHDDYVCVREVK